MKMWIVLALAALLCVPAQAEEPEFAETEDFEEEDSGSYEEYEEDRTIEGAQLLETDEVYYLDLDGDGTEETVRASMQYVEEEETLQLQVETDELVYTYDTYVLYEEAAYVVDLDGDGKLELLLTGDEASADYLTCCVRFSREGGLQPIEFADAGRGENTGEYAECGYGRVTAVNGATLTMVGSQDALGTWMFSREFTLRDGRFELDDGGVWRTAEDLDDPDLWEYRSLTAVRELPVTMEDGGDATLPAGTRFVVTETDKVSFVGFQTQDGLRGRISVAPNTEEGWGFLIDGKSENDYFEYIPYAD